MPVSKWQQFITYGFGNGQYNSLYFFGFVHDSTKGLGLYNYKLVEVKSRYTSTKS